MARIHAGPLCRLYAGDADPVRFIAGVEAWRRDLQAALVGRLQQPLNWNETAEAPSLWTDCGASGFAALRLFALYAERSELELPDTVPPLLELDACFRAASDEGFAGSRYGQLLACSAWLPFDLPLTFRAVLPDGSAAEIGAVAVLCDQLRWLDQRTFQAGAAEIARWLALEAPIGGDLLAAARRGYAALWFAAEAALRHGAPLVVQES